jgi:hypothetical protein
LIDFGVDNLIVILPDHNIAHAAIAAHCIWERINGNFRRLLLSFFPAYASGKVDTEFVIKACYKQEYVPTNADILFSDENFKFFENSSKNKTVQNGIYIYGQNPLIIANCQRRIRM